MNPTVSTVILAHNNYTDTFECLHSVLKVNYNPLTIWLVDNGSTDRTAQLVKENFPQVQLVQTHKNLGVAGGFNAGIVTAIKAGAKYIFILNNDTVVEPNIIQVLLTEAQKNPDYGILMPKILHYSDRNRIWSIGARSRLFPPAIVMIGLNKLDDYSYSKPRLLEFAPTCALFIPSRVFERIGLLDDGYFFYYDDWDYSLRVRQAGYKIAYIPQARIYHKVSRTINRTRKTPFYWQTLGRSGARFYRRHGKPVFLTALLNLGYLILREGLRNGLPAMYYLITGVIEGFRQPLSPYPNLEKI
ncbi:MAG: glycosyltransferase family 2 protein [Candidatus Methanomethylicaceae archaeon]